MGHDGYAEDDEPSHRSTGPSLRERPRPASPVRTSRFAKRGQDSIASNEETDLRWVDSGFCLYILNIEDANESKRSRSAEQDRSVSPRPKRARTTFKSESSSPRRSRSQRSVDDGLPARSSRSRRDEYEDTGVSPRRSRSRRAINGGGDNERSPRVSLNRRTIDEVFHSPDEDNASISPRRSRSRHATNDGDDELPPHTSRSRRTDDNERATRSSRRAVEEEDTSPPHPPPRARRTREVDYEQEEDAPHVYPSRYERREQPRAQTRSERYQKRNDLELDSGDDDVINRVNVRQPKPKAKSKSYVDQYMPSKARLDREERDQRQNKEINYRPGSWKGPKRQNARMGSFGPRSDSDDENRNRSKKYTTAFF